MCVGYLVFPGFAKLRSEGQPQCRSEPRDLLQSGIQAEFAPLKSSCSAKAGIDNSLSTCASET